MKATELNVRELRIGNRIKKKERDHRVTMSTFMRIAEMGIEDFATIPLTSEWLEKFGFKKNVIPHHWSGPREERTFWRIEGLIEQTGVNLIVEGGRAFMGFTELCKLEYVHQLQNLYFALTGEELEVNG